jgi:serine/threonine protein kinase
LIKNFEHTEYESERKVFEYLSRSLPVTTDIVVFPNYELFDRSKDAYVECDAIVVTRAFVAIVELKDWAGRIVTDGPKWQRGTGLIDSPHVVNNRKCKVLKTYIQHALSGVTEARLPFVQSVVALTSDHADVEGATRAKQAISTIATVTFDGMEELASYLKQRLHDASGNSDRALSDVQFRKLIAQLDQDRQSQAIDYADQIPGYRIREDKEATAAFITYVAERNPNIDNRLYRLRVFGKLSADAATREKQVRSLKAVTRLPYHPGIKAVQSHPNERNLIVEVSDWTDTQSLSNILAEHRRIDWRRAAHIARDVAEALDFLQKSDAALIHRNVQPNSILVCSDGHAQLSDFDLAYDPCADLTVLGCDDDNRLFVHFTAPEVFLGKSDFSSDVYSLGAVLFQAISGAEPGAVHDMAATLVTSLINAPGSTNEHACLVNLVMSMLASNSQERPSAAGVASTISGLIEPRTSEIEPSDAAVREETPYTERTKISEGATAEVYRVDNHGELFIHKVFKAGTARDQALQERDTLRAVDKLHLSILFPRVRHFSEVEGHRWCLAVDLVPGKPLRDFIRNGEQPSIDLFANVARALLEALCRLHECSDERREIIHNDINPNNVLIDAASDAVGLIDFGSASTAGVVTLRGTPGYVDPTLVSRGDMNASAQGDLYALAHTLAEWLCGGRPVEDVSTANPLLARIIIWLHRAMSADGARYASATAMLEALDEALSPSKLHTRGPAVASVEDLRVIGSERELLIVDARPPPPFQINPFVQYLNTLHNVSAGNANALAEYQATNAFFGSIYEASPIVDDVYRRLIADGEVVIVLSGHAGDGKSTIALDVLKQLRGLTVNQPLSAPPAPVEQANLNGKSISILKDMSEHPPIARGERFAEALRAGTGSWLIVTNTGPLLNTLKELKSEVEEQILELLDRPIGSALDDDTHRIIGFDKTIYIANLSKMDNVETAVGVLEKISTHSAWTVCQGCAAKQSCPINNNIATINGAPELKQRVSWMYRLLTSYERRLTMRQMSAHIAFSITGGTECAAVPGLIDQHGVQSAFRAHLFSELFFGFANGKRFMPALTLNCVEQLQAYVSRGRTRPAVELKLQNEACSEYSPLATSALPPFAHWRSKAMDAADGASARAALRRLVFMFGKVIDEDWWKVFVQDFAGSERLQDWEHWRARNDFPAAPTVRRALVRQVLCVLREHCTGFTALPGMNEKLYITLRRDDMETTQPVQVIIGEYEEGDFQLKYDRAEKMPRLCFAPLSDRVFMRLPLPLLDFVSRRSRGDFGQSLDPIYVNQLDLFCSQLVANKRLSADDIRLLSVSVTGVQKVFNVAIDNTQMEIY